MIDEFAKQLVMLSTDYFRPDFVSFARSSSAIRLLVEKETKSGSGGNGSRPGTPVRTAKIDTALAAFKVTFNVFSMVSESFLQID